jgi:hypothetical protein
MSYHTLTTRSFFINFLLLTLFLCRVNLLLTSTELTQLAENITYLTSFFTFFLDWSEQLTFRGHFKDL